jgi:hypothetical protein
MPVEDHVYAVGPRSLSNVGHRHHQPGAMGDVGQSHQPEARVLGEGIAIGL